MPSAMPSAMKSPLRVFIFGTCSASCYVCGDLLTKWLTSSLPDVLILQLLTVRSVVATALVGIVFLVRRQQVERIMFRPNLVVVRGFVLAVTIGLFALSFKYNNMTEVYVIVYLSPILVIILGRVIFGEQIRANYFVPVILMFFGAFIMKLPVSDLFAKSTVLRELFSQASQYAYLTMVFYALYLIITQTAELNLADKKRNDVLFDIPLQMTFSAFVLCTLCLLVASAGTYVVNRHLLNLDMNATAAVVAAGALSAVGIYTGTQAIRFGSASEAAPYGYFEVVLAAGIDLLIFQRSLSFQQYIGSAIIVFSAIYLTVLRAKSE